jgi:hypothetical protein
MNSISFIPKINPIKNSGNDLKFTKDEMISFIKQNPEVLSEEYWSGKKSLADADMKGKQALVEGDIKGRQALVQGITDGIVSAVGSVTGGFKQRAADQAQATQRKEDYANAIEVAKIGSSRFNMPNTSGITFR